MAKHYVTIGQGHRHEINGKIVHPNIVVRYEAENYPAGRKIAHHLFGRKFCFDYHDKDFNHKDMEYFPGGFLDITPEDIEKTPAHSMDWDA